MKNLFSETGILHPFWALVLGAGSVVFGVGGLLFLAADCSAKMGDASGCGALAFLALPVIVLALLFSPIFFIVLAFLRLQAVHKAGHATSRAADVRIARGVLFGLPIFFVVNYILMFFSVSFFDPFGPASLGSIALVWFLSIVLLSVKREL